MVVVAELHSPNSSPATAWKANLVATAPRLPAILSRSSPSAAVM